MSLSKGGSAKSSSPEATSVAAFMYAIWFMDWKASLKAKTPIRTTSKYGPLS